MYTAAPSAPPTEMNARDYVTGIENGIVLISGIR
jgi:hypothetical protein